MLNPYNDPGPVRAARYPYLTWRVMVGAFGLLLIATVAAAIWARGTDLDWTPRAPESYPDWLTPDILRVRVTDRDGDHFPYYATQQFLGSASVLFGQYGSELPIDARGKQRVQVDGVEGLLWRLEPDEWRDADSNPYAEDKPERDTLGLGNRLYRRVLEQRRTWESRGEPREGVIVGLAIAIQWNRDGVHYVLIGQDKGPMTEEALLQLANSLALTEVFEKV